jgi:type II secretion system protein N
VKKILIVLIAIPILFLSLWITVPETSIQSIIEDSATDKLHMEVEGFKKGLFYNVTIENLTLRSSGKEIISFSDIHGRINPLNLAILKLSLTVDGTLGGGDIAGDINIAKNKKEVRLDFKKININEMPLFRLGKVKGTGTVAGRYTMMDDTGHVDFVAKDASFEPAVFSGIKVPLNLFNGVTGSVDIKGNIVNIVSVSFEGKDIYARLKGVVKDAVMDLNMEVMPGKAYLENPIFLGELQKYMVSPGYYMIPIKGKFSI